MGLLKKGQDNQLREGEEPYIKSLASLGIELYYFNVLVQAYEPILEPWSVSYSVYQEEKYTENLSVVKSDQMLDLNVTYAMVVAVENLKKKLQQTEEDWQTEEVDEFDEQFMGRRVSKQASKKDGYEFFNKLGLPVKVMVEDTDIDMKKQ